MGNSFSLELDHLVVTAPSLEAGLDHVEAALGVVVPAGGAHPLMGTHNALMGLGGGAYLEVIAPDPSARAERPRWYGLDHVARPSLSHWVLRTNRLEAAMARAGPEVGKALAVTRGDLAWDLSVPDDGALPLGGALPSLIRWPDGKGPAGRLPDLGYRLEKFEVITPYEARINALMSAGLDDARVGVSAGAAVGFRAGLRSARGYHVLEGTG